MSSMDAMIAMDRVEARKLLESGRLTPAEAEAIARQTTGIEADDRMFSGSGIQPWHFPWIGTASTVVDGRLTAADALAAAGLDWTVEKEPIFLSDGKEIPRQYAIVRQSDRKPLGVVMGRYTILQNAEAFDWANYMVGGDGTHFETAGSLKGGRMVYLTLKTPFQVDLPGGDKLETYVLIYNRHDGSGSVTAAVITIRVECKNTLSRSIAGALGVARIRHTANLAARMGQARTVLGLAQGASDRAEEVASQLLAQKMSSAKFAKFMDLLMAPESAEEATPRAKAMVERRRETIEQVYRTHPTQEAIRGTAWGAYNAVTFYNDHLTPRRDTEDADSSKADQRMLAIVNGNNIGDRALELLLKK